MRYLKHAVSVAVSFLGSRRWTGSCHIFLQASGGQESLSQPLCSSARESAEPGDSPLYNRSKLTRVERVVDEVACGRHLGQLETAEGQRYLGGRRGGNSAKAFKQNGWGPGKTLFSFGPQGGSTGDGMEERRIEVKKHSGTGMSRTHFVWPVHPRQWHPAAKGGSLLSAPAFRQMGRENPTFPLADPGPCA